MCSLQRQKQPACFEWIILTCIFTFNFSVPVSDLGKIHIEFFQTVFAYCVQGRPRLKMQRPWKLNL